MMLSFVIPCYNMELYLPWCLDSLIAQDLAADQYEIIVVNDESKDKTLEIAESYASKFSNIKVIDKNNAGVGAARNTGLDHSKGKYIYFLDPDDYLLQNVLGRLLTLLENNALDILTFKSTAVYNGTFEVKKSAIKTEEESLSIMDGVEYIASRKYANEIWWYIIKRDFIQTSGLRFIEGKWMEDAILTASLFCRAKRMAHTNFDVHRYRILPNSAMRNKSPEHYKKVIYDNAHAAIVFDELIAAVPESHPKSAECKKRLRTRQQSFVFFLLVRLMKSDICLNEIDPMLNRFRNVKAYPLTNFLGIDYHGFKYGLLVKIFNEKILIKPFMKTFRTFYNLAS